jgi:hypothetical protein
MRNGFCMASGSVTGTMAAGDLEDRAGDERCVLKMNYRVGDFTHVFLASPALVVQRINNADDIALVRELKVALCSAKAKAIRLVKPCVRR